MAHRMPRDWFEPGLSPHLRDEFTLLSAQHLRGQARLLFAGFILSLPMVVAARVVSAPLWIGVGLPVLVFIFSVGGLWAVHERPQDKRRAKTLIKRAWFACFTVAAIGSLWCILSWLYSPLETRVYYVAIMSIGALTLGYMLTATRIIGVSALLVTLAPISIVLLATGEMLPSALAVGLLIAMVFQALLIGRHQRLLVELVNERHQSSELARTDPLTGVANRRAFLEFAKELAIGGSEVRLVSLDLDQFKVVNDRYGHDTGDEVLMIVATILSGLTGNGIKLARMGGEEFALIGRADNLRPELAATILDHIRSAEMPHGQPLTASLGVACATLERPGDWEELYRNADEALYAAKAQGRNRVVTFSGFSRETDSELKFRSSVVSN